MKNFSRNSLTSLIYAAKRYLSCSGSAGESVGLVLGLYAEPDELSRTYFEYTKTAEAFNSLHENRLTELIKKSGPVPQKGEVRVFYDFDKRFSAVCVVGIGTECMSYCDHEEIDEYKEAIRCAAGTGCRALQDLYMKSIFVDSFGHSESAAEGAALAIWKFQELKQFQNLKFIPKLELFEDCDFTGWQIGLQKAAAQNLARQFCETPANLLTPIQFAQNAVEVLCKAGVNVEVKVRQWAKLMDFNAFLAAASGSCEPPIFLEITYFGCDPDIAPILLVGKGITFDSGGIHLKSCNTMKHMRGDILGGASVVAATRAASALQLPINIRGLIPLCENLPGVCAMKPGDIVRAKNGKTIVIENTDFDGRLCLADALAYGLNYNPRFCVTVGTLSREIEDGLGAAASGVFSNSDSLYEQMRVASIHTGDKIWRLPLWHHFTEKITLQTTQADVKETYNSTGAPCSAAAFLNEFIPPTDWIHLDTYGVMRSDGITHSYLRRGMSGRPTRTLLEFLAQFACQTEKKEETSGR